jgi:hypothetical protein
VSSGFNLGIRASFRVRHCERGAALEVLTRSSCTLMPLSRESGVLLIVLAAENA